jgi:hypothetical protein
LHAPLGFDPANVVTAAAPIGFKRFPRIAAGAMLSAG